MAEEGIQFRRNRMPQWRMEAGIYFVTWCLAAAGDSLSPAERTLVADAIKHFKDIRYRLAVCVVMDDHVHLVLQTLPGHDLSKVLHSLKSYTATMINKARGVEGKPEGQLYRTAG